MMTGAAGLRAVLAAACCLGLGACGSHARVAAPATSAGLATPTPAGAPTPPGSPAPGGTPAPSRTSSPATASTLGRPSHTPVCRTARLKITILRSMAAGGTAGGYLGFTSDARRPCVLHGWPTVAGISAAGKTSTAIRRHSMAFGPSVNGEPVVTIKPGALAVAVFTVADGKPPYCPPSYRFLRVTPPGNDRPVVISAWLDHPYVDGYLPACTRIWVTPVVPAADVYRP